MVSDTSRIAMLFSIVGMVINIQTNQTSIIWIGKYSLEN